MHLAPCTDCHRHVADSESACPFCGGALTLVRPTVKPKVVRLTRAAIFYFGLSACSGVADTNEPPPQPPIVQPYGAPGPEALPEDSPVANAHGTPAALDAPVVDPAETAEDPADTPPPAAAQNNESILRVLEGITTAPAYGAPSLPPE